MARDHNGRVIFKSDDGVMREIFPGRLARLVMVDVLAAAQRAAERRETRTG